MYIEAPCSRTGYRWHPGLGDAAATVQTVSAIGTPILTGALASSAAATAAATGVPAVILGMAPALAVPVIGAAIVGVTIAIVVLLRAAQGCGQTCIVTSQWANEAEDLLKKNLAGYLALPTPRPRSAQNTALSNFNVVWARLQQMCGEPATGDAGRRCIADRQQGACKWQDSSGQCWNWFAGYHDPIASDLNVADDSVAAQVSGAWRSAALGGELLPLALGLGLIIAAVTIL